MSDGSVANVEVLFEAGERPRVPLPDELERRYGGPLALASPVVFANFVTSIDGVAAIAGVRTSSVVIGGGAPADRFVMGLLRAVADAVVIGSGTLREHEGPWTAQRAFPDAAVDFGHARRALGLSEAPTLVVVTAGGDLPAHHPSLADAVVVTTEAGARTAARRTRCREIVEVGDGAGVDARAAVSALRERGFERILTEGGPRLMRSLLEASVVDDLFLTISPKLLGGGPGRAALSDGDGRSALETPARLVGVRRAGELLLLRYSLARPAAS